MLGKVARKVENRNYGFIRGEDGNDYFFHADDCSGVYDTLEAESQRDKGDGSRVSFEGEPGRENKLRARNVVPA